MVTCSSKDKEIPASNHRCFQRIDITTAAPERSQGQQLTMHHCYCWWSAGVRCDSGSFGGEGIEGRGAEGALSPDQLGAVFAGVGMLVSSK